MMSYNTVDGLSSALSEDYILYFLVGTLSKSIHEVNFTRYCKFGVHFSDAFQQYVALGYFMYEI